MRKAIVSAVAVACLTGLLCLGGMARIQADEPATPAGKTFAGKLVFIMLKTQSTDDEILLEKVEMKQLGAQWFLVGKCLEHDGLDGEKLKGHTMWVSLKDAGTIVEFKSYDEFKKKMGPNN